MKTVTGFTGSNRPARQARPADPPGRSARRVLVLESDSLNSILADPKIFLKRPTKPLKMNKILKWILRIFLGLIVVVILFVVGILAYVAVNNKQKEKSAEKLRVGPADKIEVDGLAFRDLNKSGTLDPYEDFRVPVDVRVEDVLSQMSVEEKSGMMLHPFLFEFDGESAFPGAGFAKILANPMDFILNKQIRHVTSSLGTKDAAVHARWQNGIQEIAEHSRLGIPMTVSTDPRHSVKSGAAITMDAFSRWPDPLGFGAIGDSALMVEFGRIAAQEYRAVGIHTALSPMADMATEPRWGRISGTFGEDVDLVTRLTVAYINGFQGDSLSNTSVTCMTKHFPGGGPQDDGWDPHFKYGTDQAYPGNNFDHHLIPFIAAIKAGTAQMMPYYGVPAGLTSEDVGFAFNKEIIAGLLQDELKYEGVVCTDWFVITSTKFLGITFFQATDHGVEHLKNIDKVEKALNAGIDQFGGENIPDHMIELVQTERIPEERLNKSVRKLLKIKFELGLFENPYVDEEQAQKICNSEPFNQAGKEAILKSMILLTNQENNGEQTLPLSEGLNVYLVDIDFVTASRYARVVSDMDKADAILMRLNTPYEARDGIMESIFHQGSLEFQPDSLQSILSVLQTRPTIVGLYLDRPAVIPEIAEQAAAIIGHFGTSDEALLDMIFGWAEPTGKLPFEMPSSTLAVEAQKEDMPYDSEAPLFPFGHGLNYQNPE